MVKTSIETCQVTMAFFTFAFAILSVADAGASCQDDDEASLIQVKLGALDGPNTSRFSLASSPSTSDIHEEEFLAKAARQVDDIQKAVDDLQDEGEHPEWVQKVTKQVADIRDEIKKSFANLDNPSMATLKVMFTKLKGTVGDRSSYYEMDRQMQKEHESNTLLNADEEGDAQDPRTEQDQRNPTADQRTTKDKVKDLIASETFAAYHALKDRRKRQKATAAAAPRRKSSAPDIISRVAKFIYDTPSK